MSSISAPNRTSENRIAIAAAITPRNGELTCSKLGWPPCDPSANLINVMHNHEHERFKDEPFGEKNRGWRKRKVNEEQFMETRIDEIAPKIYRFSTYVPEANLLFNQYLIDGAEPLLFHTGMRQLFPLVREAMSTVIDVERLRWITFGHYEADECGSMNEWLTAAPQSSVAHGAMGSRVSIMDQAIRAPRLLSNNEVLDIGGYRVRRIETPHVPHGWDAGLMYEETTQTLFAGDLFTQFGNGGALTEADIVAPAIVLEEAMHATALTPATATTIRSLAQLPSQRMALMHGPVFDASPKQALESLADYYEKQLALQM